MTTRRDFLRATTTAAAAFAGAPALLLRTHRNADIIVRNGTVFDGLGAAGRELDVAIANGVILDVGKKLPPARRRRD